ncbi:MAG: VWA domain-containing protein [Planctomycetota bacterium]
MMSEFHFLRPLAFGLVPVVALIWWWIRRAADPRNDFQAQFAPHLLSHLVVSETTKRVWNPVNLLLVIWLSAIVAIAGPTWKRQPSPLADDKSQLMIVIKVSESMMSDDVPPSRLERARGKLADLLATRAGSANGLIAYSGSAHLVMPATEDADVINHMLQALEPSVMPSEGDALTEAIELAFDQLSGSDVGGSVLVVTDTAPPASSVSSLNSLLPKFPVQFLAMLRTDEAYAASGIDEVASTLNVPVQRLASDGRDVDTLGSRADRTYADVVQDDATSWQDAGYYLVPLIALLGLSWSRRGWSVQA